MFRYSLSIGSIKDFNRNKRGKSFNFSEISIAKILKLFDSGSAATAQAQPDLRSSNINQSINFSYGLHIPKIIDLPLNNR